MPHASMKLVPGVDQNRTPTLNEAAISESNLIRFVPDRNGVALVQKLGGWSLFYSQGAVSSTVRSMHAWQTLNDEDYLALGAENFLGTILDGSLKSRTPQISVVNPVLGASTINGSNEVTITDTNSNIDNFDAVLIQTQITVGGLRLQGLYQCTAASANTYKIQATDVLGYPDLATSTSSTAYTPVFTMTAGSFSVNVTLPNHKYLPGDTASFLIPTTVQGITIYGNYTVVQLDTVSPNDIFVINANDTATNVAGQPFTLPMNNGLARYVYFNGVGPISAGTGYGILGYGEGGYGTGTAPDAFRTLTPIGAKGTGTTATLSISTNMAIPIGSVVTVSGMTPAGYNTASPVAITASTCNIFNITNITNDGGTYVTFTHDGAGAIEAGTIFTTTGVNPGAYNGTWTVYSSTPATTSVQGTVVIASALTTAYVSGGVLASNTLSYLSAGTGAMTVAGTILINSIDGLSTTDWSLDNWGQILLACPAYMRYSDSTSETRTGGAIYQWLPSAGNPDATVIPQAPPVNDGMFVAMPQRQIVAWGSTFTGIQDPLLIRWCDIENYSVWAANLTNQAGSYRIPKGSKIVSCIQGPQQGLVWTDIAVWAMQYIGAPYVYSFNEIGNGCGLIGRKAATSMNGVVYWMSQSQFFQLSGSGVQPIPCPVWDVIFQDLDTTNLDKIRVAANSRFGEISWFYPTMSNGGEVSHYVKYNIYLNQWDYGTMGRTAWINQSVFGPPIGASADNLIVQHETSSNAVNAVGNPVAMDSFFETGYFQLNDGDLLTFIDQFWPDAKWGYYGSDDQSASLSITFKVSDYSGRTPVVHGPYVVDRTTDYITPRFRGRLVAIRVESNNVGTFWRLGNMRYRWQPDGKF